ncbi:PAS domain S-box protein, partial [bacterium]|nr:PAS domain S-box protein [bacterium]
MTQATDPESTRQQHSDTDETAAWAGDVLRDDADHCRLLQLMQDYEVSGLMRWDLTEDRIVYSPGLLELLDLPLKKLGPTIHDLAKWVAEEDRMKLIDRLERLRMGRERTVNVRARFDLPGSRFTWLQIRASVAEDNEGNPLDILGLFEEVRPAASELDTEDAAGELLRTIFENSLDVILLVDLEGNILDCNTLACRQFGYERDDLLETPFSDLVSPSMVEEMGSSLVEAFLTGGSSMEYEARLKDGTLFPIEAAGVMNVVDGIPQVLLNMRDISHRKQWERDREHFLESLGLMQRFESIGAVAGGLAHQFNNIFGGLLGHVELLQMKAKQYPELQDTLDMMADTIDQASGITGQLSAYSSRSEPEIRKIHLARLLQSMHSLLDAVS